MCCEQEEVHMQTTTCKHKHMQTTGRATTKTKTSTDRRLKAAVLHFLLLTLSYSSKHITLKLYGIKYLTLRHDCQGKTACCEVWRYKLKKQRSFPELAEVPCVTFQLVPRFLWRIKIGK